LEERDGNLLSIYRKYEELMEFNKVIDFGGILTDTLRLFSDSEILGKCRKNTKYILVDEYQDINQAQFEFIKSLCTEDTELFCVGDDDQSIYGWRGAKPDFILNFKKDFIDAKELSLDETRRCSENIIKAALNLISKIPGNKRRPKTIGAYSKGGAPVYILKSSSEVQEARWIAGWIKNEIFKKQISPQEILIICRDIELAKDVVSELKKRNIPVEYWREGAMFKDREVKDIFAHLRVIVNPEDNLALRRCLLSKSVRNVGAKRVSYFRKEAQRLNRPIWDILLSNYNCSRAKKWERNIFEFIKWIKGLMNKDTSVGNLIDEIIKRLHPSEDNRHIEKLKKLVQALSDISLKKFLNEIVIKRRLDIIEGGPEPEEEGKAVAVMSMHSSKGLTYRIVFILGMEEGIFPRNNSKIDDEERRLCYVAMTRAKEKLFLCTAKRRKGRPAKGVNFFDTPSKFLEDILPCEAQIIDNHSKN